MKLTLDDAKKVAKLASLPLNDEEALKYSEELSKILDYVELLNTVDTTNIEPTFNVTGKENVFSEDTVSESLTQVEALSNTKLKKDNLFITKGVFNEE